MKARVLKASSMAALTGNANMSKGFLVQFKSGHIGMVLCDAMLGEVTAAMACAVGASSAHKILVPVTRCQATVAGVPRMTMAEAVACAVREAENLCRQSIRT